MIRTKTIATVFNYDTGSYSLRCCCSSHRCHYLTKNKASFSSSSLFVQTTTRQQQQQRRPQRITATATTTAAANDHELLLVTRRTFAAFGTNWKETSKRKKKNRQKHNKKKKPRSSDRQPSEGTSNPATKTSQQSTPSVSSSTAEIVVPPLFALPTASPNAYVARAAVLETGIDQNIFTTTDLKTINTISSSSSTNSRFEYFGTSGEVIAAAAKSKNNNNDGVNEVAFLGRSNVGKSSLLNAIMGQSLARTSKTPGRTQHAHYYGWLFNNTSSSSDNNSSIRSELLGFAVDLPGYGYAIGPQEAVDRWQQRTQDFLLQRRHDAGLLKRVYLLVDSRHGPTDFDTSVMRWLDEGQLPYTIILTKCDTVKKPTIIKHINQVCMRYQHENEIHNKLQQQQQEFDDYDGPDGYSGIFMSPVVHVTSSKRGTGIKELLWSIETDFYNHE